jgi:hypothetical protein
MQRAGISRRRECDKPVTVVCSRYERERKPVSLIRTCQELVFSNSTSREPGFEISKAMLIVFGMFSKELDLSMI